MFIRTVTKLFASLLLVAAFALPVTSALAQDDVATGTLEFQVLTCVTQDQGLVASVPGGTFPDYPTDDCRTDVPAVFNVVGIDDPSQEFTADTSLETSLVVPAGAYTVTDLTTGLTVDVNVQAEVPTAVQATHLESEIGEGSPISVTVKVLDCVGLEGPTLFVDPGQTTGCTDSQSAAMVSFYMYGDNSDEPSLIAEVGPDYTGPFDLVSGAYAIVHEDSQVQIDATFSEDPEHFVIVALPVDDGTAPTPTPVDPGATETPVTELPGTGSGDNGSISMSTVALGAMGILLIAAIAAGGVLQVQRQR